MLLLCVCVCADACGPSFGCASNQLHSYWLLLTPTGSYLALGINAVSGVGTNCGNRKFMAAASLMPSGHVRIVGDPNTEHILEIGVWVGFVCVCERERESVCVCVCVCVCMSVCVSV